MTIVQWLLLILVIAIVGGASWYLRRHRGNDPWQGMEEPDNDDALERGESMEGDSYIVGVRARSSTPDPGGAVQATDAHSAAAAADAWAAFKTHNETEPAPDRNMQEPADAQVSQTSAGTAPSELPPIPQRATQIKPRRAPAGPEQIFMLHVSSTDNRLFDGPDVHAALD